MKLHFSILLLLLACFLNGQSENDTIVVENDPLWTRYIFGGSSEIMVLYQNDEEFTRGGILDIGTTLNEFDEKTTLPPSEFLDVRKIALGVGDFDSDGDDEVVYIQKEFSGGGNIMITVASLNSETGEMVTISKDPNIEEANIARMRIAVGNFDADPNDEFALCYGSEGAVYIRLFEISNSQISEIAVHTIPYFVDAFYDIASGDLDGSGRDEIILLFNNGDLERNTVPDPDRITSSYKLFSFSYDATNDDLVAVDEAGQIIAVTDSTSENHSYKNVHTDPEITNIRIACGDIDGDQLDEVLVGYSMYYQYHPGYWCMVTYLHSHDLDHSDTFVMKDNFFVDGTSGQGDYYNLQEDHNALTLLCEDLNHTSPEEVLINSNDEIIIYSRDENGVSQTMGHLQFFQADTYLNIMGNEAFILADFNPDQDDYKEIVRLKTSVKASDQSADGDIPDLSLEIYEIETISENSISFHGPKEKPCPIGSNVVIASMAAGDFDRDDAVIYLVGEPVVNTIKDFENPVLVLNAPPVHFDILGNEEHDVCNVFPTASDSDFSITYVTEKGKDVETKVEVGHDWGISAEASIYASLGGCGFENKLKGRYEQGKSWYETNKFEEKIEQSFTTTTEDMVYWMGISLKTYEYPIYDRDSNQVGHIAVMTPTPEEPNSGWKEAAKWDHPAYIFNHEPGNILSYQRRSNEEINSHPDVFEHESLKPKIYIDELVGNGTSGTFGFSQLDHLTSQEVNELILGAENNFFFEAGKKGTLTTKAGIGIEAGDEVEYKFGFSFNLNASYTFNRVRTHTTTFSDAFSITGNLNDVGAAYKHTAHYSVKAYIYRSRGGALVVDYSVVLDENNNSFWQEHYGQKPDLAFILPYRYTEEKEGVDIKESLKNRTKEIQFIPHEVKPKDTVRIITRVHNYSLMDYDGDLEIDYYLGHPDHGGIKLEDISGNSGSNMPVKMSIKEVDPSKDFEAYQTFDWVVPESLTCSPRIYAVIDPLGEVEEIHENNNIGWNTLHLLGCDDCPDFGPGVSTKLKYTKDIFKIFPNPMKDEARISFTVSQPGKISISLYDISGRLIREIVNQDFPEGEQEITMNRNRLKSGIYLLRFCSGNSSDTRKIIVF